MSRATSTASRQLSLTEELEKLEQSITLTLQEIDANFSRAHQIVTTNILPVVEQYGDHSKSVWEASKFWKVFFESSANCLLSNYEEEASNQDESTQQPEESSLPMDESTEQEQTAGDITETPKPKHRHMDENDTMMTSNEISGSTPRPPATKTIQSHSQFADLGSPYEDLRQELKGDDGAQEDFEIDYTLGSEMDDQKDETEVLSDSDADESALLAAHTRRLPDMSMTPRAPATTLKLQASTARGGGKDPLLHRVLDKNYRIQATPLKGRFSPIKNMQSRWEKEEKEEPGNAWDTPMSSPEISAPKMRSAAFMSPIKAARLAGMSGPLMAPSGPRTPGVSVQTPVTQKRRDLFASARRAGGDDTETLELGRPIGERLQGESKGKGKKKDEITWSSDEDDELYGGFSPPKTMQFAMPQSKLMQTPAREASRRIVEDILFTAGAAQTESSEFSPSLVKMNKDILDDSF